MEVKINSNNWNFQSVFKYLIIAFLVVLLIYTRFINLGWGLPYPMHPDERNMVNAIQGLSCNLTNFRFQISYLQNCFNPHFFAYGQFPLYLGYVLSIFYKLFFGKLNIPISFEEGALSLRIISATASLLMSVLMLKIIKIFIKKESEKKDFILMTVALIIFSPYAIQFSHFGTTESLLMLFYVAIVYLSLLLIENKIIKSRYVLFTAFVMGLALATKVSSAVFGIIPIFILIMRREKQKIKDTFVFGLLTIFVFLVFAPHNIISFKELLGSLGYERDVALGSYVAFYTRQFVGSIPVIFQAKNIFPYVLGWGQYLLFVLGFLFLSWKDRSLNLLRFAFIAYFLPNAFIFAKWTRFMSPVFPIMTLISILYLHKIYSFLSLRLSKTFLNILTFIIVGIAIVPGIGYLSVYQNKDVRHQASDWIYKNIPANSYILSETANVVDIPLVSNNMSYRVISFNFYDLDTDTSLQDELKSHLEKADYIFVPSRRIFANLQEKNILLKRYYQDLDSGALGFTEVAQFNSYPKIQFMILNHKFQIDFPDEKAEETWSVFDHPVIRIYKKIK